MGICFDIQNAGERRCYVLNFLELVVLDRSHTWI
jgi:hypothetical protein